VCQTKNQHATSETGGWCNAHARKHVTDRQLASALAELFAGKTVVGLGDGTGEYRKLILGSGRVSQYHSYDGSPFIDNITDGKVCFVIFLLF